MWPMQVHDATNSSGGSVGGNVCGVGSLARRDVLRINEICVAFAGNTMNADRTLKLRRSDAVQYDATVPIVVEGVVASIQFEWRATLEGNNRAYGYATKDFICDRTVGEKSPSSTDRKIVGAVDVGHVGKVVAAWPITLAEIAK